MVRWREVASVPEYWRCCFGFIDLCGKNVAVWGDKVLDPARPGGLTPVVNQQFPRGFWVLFIVGHAWKPSTRGNTSTGSFQGLPGTPHPVSKRFQDGQTISEPHEPHFPNDLHKSRTWTTSLSPLFSFCTYHERPPETSSWQCGAIILIYRQLSRLDSPYDSRLFTLPLSVTIWKKP